MESWVKAFKMLRSEEWGWWPEELVMEVRRSWRHVTYLYRALLLTLYTLSAWLSSGGGQLQHQHDDDDSDDNDDCDKYDGHDDCDE